MSRGVDCLNFFRSPVMKTIFPAGSLKNIMGFAKGIKKFWKYLGAGFISGASDDDAAAITTYAIAGTRLGFSSLWTVFLTFPLMTAIQEMSARIGMVTKMGLAGTITQYYSRW